MSRSWFVVLGKVQKGGGAGGGGRPGAPREQPPPFHGDPRPEAQAAGRRARQEPKEARGAAGREGRCGAVRPGGGVAGGGVGFRGVRRAAPPLSERR